MDAKRREADLRDNLADTGGSGWKEISGQMGPVDPNTVGQEEYVEADAMRGKVRMCDVVLSISERKEAEVRGQSVFECVKARIKAQDQVVRCVGGRHCSECVENRCDPPCEMSVNEQRRTGCRSKLGGMRW